MYGGSAEHCWIFDMTPRGGPEGLGVMGVDFLSVFTIVHGKFFYKELTYVAPMSDKQSQVLLYLSN